MIVFARKKILRNDRLVQLLLLLGLLRGSSDFIYDDRSLNLLNHEDFSLGGILEGSQNAASLMAQEMHPKSMDRVLANYQQSLLDDLNTIGDFGRFLPSFNRLPQQDIHAYLLNAESSINSPPTPEDENYSSPTSSPIAVEQNLPWTSTDTDASQIQWSEDNGYNLFEDLDFLETIWKQDVDLGVPRDIFEEDQEHVELENASKMDFDSSSSLTTKNEDPENDPPNGNSQLNEWFEDKQWDATLNLTVDSETGELQASKISEGHQLDGEGPILSFSGNQDRELDVSRPSTSSQLLEDDNLHLEFNLDEALKFVGLDASDYQEGDTEQTTLQDSESDSGCGDSNSSEFGGESIGSSLEALNETLDDMIQASQLHPHHPRNFQGRLGGLVRSGSMEQRWQDLASLLSLPSPDHTHQSPPSMATSPVQHPQPNPIHHPHALYPPPHEGTSLGAASSPRGVLIHNVPMPDTHNITYANSMGASSHLVASSMNLANNSEIATSEHHHYKMETSGNMSQDMIYYQQSSGAEMNQSTDGFLSSILNDEDLQLMDIPMTDYNGRGGNGDYGASYRYPPPDDPHRLAPVAQKKHQMFGKRFVHDNNLHGTAPNNIPVVTPVGLPISSYPPHYVPAQTNIPMEGATAMDPSEMKYSCSMDFRTPETANAAVDHVQHNHTYHMSPEGSSGLSRHNARDSKRGRKSDLEKSLSRDEKRARGSNLPITCEDIINLPMDEFNERISKYDLTEAQLSLIRDIRRRGKNKVAAQNCRKRKLDQIVHLAEEVKVIHYRKSELHSQLEHLTGEKSRIQQKFSRLYGHIFQSLRDAKGNPYSPHDFSLQQSADGNVLLVPRASPPPHHSDKSRHPKDDRGH